MVSQIAPSLEYPNFYLLRGPEGMQPTLHIIFHLFMKIIGCIDPVSYVVPLAYNPLLSNWSSDSMSISTTYNEDISMEDMEPGKRQRFQLERLILRDLSDNRSLILHPLLSAYAKCYPDYNVFSKEPLIDNGYVEGGAGDFTPRLSVLSPIKTISFQILSLPEHDN